MPVHDVIHDGAGVAYMVDDDGYPIALTGALCPSCGLPRVPYPGSQGRHPTCPRPVEKELAA